MNPDSEPLALRDIHLPDPVSWWPPAPGWWVLFGLLLVALIGIVLLYRHFKRGWLRRTALRELQRLQDTYNTQQDGQHLVQALSVLLRRVCLSYYPRNAVAGLTSDGWLRWLDQGLERTVLQQGFSLGAGQVLVSAPYSQHMDVDVEALLHLCRTWIKALPPISRGAWL